MHLEIYNILARIILADLYIKKTIFNGL